MLTIAKDGSTTISYIGVFVCVFVDVIDVFVSLLLSLFHKLALVQSRAKGG